MYITKVVIMDQFKIVVSVVHNKKINRSADKQQRNTNEKNW